jgi:hypothetical protein
VEVSIREHLLETVGERALLNENVRSVVRIYIKEKFDLNFSENISTSTEVLTELEHLSVSLVSQITSWKNEKKQREKVTSELHEFIQNQILQLPHELQIPPALEVMSEMTNAAIEAPYKAIFARAGQTFAENSLFMMVVLILEFPSWLKGKLDSGELTYNSN